MLSMAEGQQSTMGRIPSQIAYDGCSKLLQANPPWLPYNKLQISQSKHAFIMFEYTVVKEFRVSF